MNNGKGAIMQLTGLHLLLTYQCTFECEHCFVWGSPFQSGTFSLEAIHDVLHQAREQDTVKSIFFEGGEPFLYYPILVQAVKEAAQQGFQVGIVSNAYWATELEDALEWLQPFAGLLSDLTVSSDLFHYSETISCQARLATQAAEQLGIPVGLITVAQPEDRETPGAAGQLPVGESGVMFRGRAAVKLAGRAPQRSFQEFTTCLHEDLREPGRVHLDPFGNLHICQGISLGNLFKTPLAEICAGYHPETHPITAPLLAGGPCALVEQYGIEPKETYADACQMCYEIRLSLRSRFPEILLPDQMYGVYS
jgi:hypothetical protein